MNSDEADFKMHADAAAEFKKHADAAMDEFMNIARIPPMTLRDYFAAAALTCSLRDATHGSGIARDCYAIADAMLKERDK